MATQSAAATAPQVVAYGERVAVRWVNQRGGDRFGAGGDFLVFWTEKRDDKMLGWTFSRLGHAPPGE